MNACYKGVSCTFLYMLGKSSGSWRETFTSPHDQKTFTSWAREEQATARNHAPTNIMMQNANNSRNNNSRNTCKIVYASNSMDKGKSMGASNSWANNIRNTFNSMDKGKSMDTSNSRANDRRNTYNTMGESNSMNNGKSIDSVTSWT
jgi:hypothetical protein